MDPYSYYSDGESPQDLPQDLPQGEYNSSFVPVHHVDRLTPRQMVYGALYWVSFFLFFGMCGIGYWIYKWKMQKKDLTLPIVLIVVIPVTVYAIFWFIAYGLLTGYDDCCCDCDCYNGCNCNCDCCWDCNNICKNILIIICCPFICIGEICKGINECGKTIEDIFCCRC